LDDLLQNAEFNIVLLCIIRWKNQSCHFRWHEQPL